MSYGKSNNNKIPLSSVNFNKSPSGYDETNNEDDDLSNYGKNMCKN